MPDDHVLPTPIETVFQPIVEATETGSRIHALECLTRGPLGTAIEGAVPLFDYVRRLGLEAEMDCACAANALRSVLNCGDALISINVHPKTLERPDFLDVLLRSSSTCELDPSQLIVEIGEQTPAADSHAFQRAIASMRLEGVRIAIDDVGYGYSNFRSIIDCKPDYVKIDRYFVRGAGTDAARRAVVKSICDLSAHFGAMVVAEGVETAADRDAMREMGIRLFQGFLYGRPMPMAFDKRDARRQQRERMSGRTKSDVETTLLNSAS